jgi:hypothetical protein
LLWSPPPSPSPGPPRAWELVTTGPTDGAAILGGGAWSADGDRVVFASLGPLPGAPAGDVIAQNVAARGAGGWQPRPIGEPFSAASADFVASEPLAVDAALSTWLWAGSQPLLPGAPPAGQTGLYLRRPDGTLEPRGAAGPRDGFLFFAASRDFQHVAFTNTAHLLPADAGRTSERDAYELAGTQLRLVGVDDAGQAISTCGSQVGDGIVSTSRRGHAVSRDGARIFFSTPAGSGCGVPRVYLRENAAHTTEISASACTRPDCDAPQGATFAGALPDGSSAFLVTARQLTNDDADDSADLYRYDVEDHALTRVSAGPAGTAADVSASLVRASDDGSRVYFTASGALVPGQGQQVAPSLYLADHGQPRLVAAADADLETAALTADGGTLAFTTATRLLPSDTDDAVDVYRYVAATGTLEQVSLGTGGRGNGAFGVTFGADGVPGAFDGDGLPYMTPDGRRLFFLTPEPLLPEDLNATPDLYEWADGDLGLVSSGGSVGAAVVYAGVSADGRGVFFATDETLLAADRNSGDQDLYVARLGGGFPDPPLQPPECEGDACQGPPGARPGRPRPGSLARAGRPVRPLGIRPLGRRARGELAAGGRATIVVDVPAAGRVVLVASARVHGHAIVAGRAAALVDGAGPVRLALRLSAKARGALRRHRVLRLSLTLRHSALGAAPATAVTLRSTR